MSALKSSIAVSLFDNGFVRHDHILAHAMGTNLSGGHEILALCRYPYGPGSRSFLEALQSGVLPDEEELPEPSRRTYYDGCLIAEVFDYRGVCDEAIDASGATWRKRAWFQRVLLRPDMCSHVSDIQELTVAVEKREHHLAFESRLLTTKHPTLDLDPTPRLQSVVDTNLTKSPAFAPQAGASVAGKKRRRERAGGVPPRPPVSMSALLLIDAADKNQTRTLMLKAQEASTKPATPSQPNVQLPDFLGDAGESTVKRAAPALCVSQKARARGIPPTLLFRKAKEEFPPQQCASYNTGSKNHERLRTIRLLLADRNASHVIRSVRNAQQNGTATTQQVQAMHKTLAELNRKGQQVCVLELVSRPARGCDVALFRGFIGDKARDVNKIELATVEEAHNFLDQFKKILDREGYICIHDGDPQKAQSQAAHQASAMDARRRVMAAAAANGQMPMQAAAAVAAAAGLSPAQRIQAQQQAAVAQAHARNAVQLQNHQAAALRRAGLVQAQQFQHQQRQAFASTMAQQQLAAAAAAKQAQQFPNMLSMSPASALRAQPQQTPQGVSPIPLTQSDMLRVRQAQHAQMIEQQARLRAQSSEPIPANAIGVNAIPPSMLSLAPTGNPSVANATAAANAAATGDTASQRSRGSGSRGSRKR